jgi:4-amino-4-deoxy-L-arabinose transferase-like glycosyltransferase
VIVPPRAVDPRRLIVWAALLGCLARAAFGLLYWHGKPLTHDEREYLALGANLAAGRGYTQTLPGEPPESAPGSARVQQFGRAPLYPAFLAPLTLTDPDLRAGRMPPDVPWAVKLAQALVGALGVWLIGAIARQIAGQRAAVWAATIAAVYPPLVWTAAFALSETFYSTLALACVWVLTPVLDRAPDASRDGTQEGASAIPPLPGERGQGVRGLSQGVAPHPDRSGMRVFAGGLLTGLAILARPAMLFFLPFALLLAWRRNARLAALLLGGTLLVVLPWSARNVIVHGRFVLVASEGGVTFWTGNHPESIGEGDLAANPHLKELNRTLRARYASLSEEAMESIYYREAFGFIAGHPFQWLGLEAKKLFYTWVPIGPSYQLHSARYFWTSVISYGAILPFALLGTAWLWRRGRGPAPAPRPESWPLPLTLWSLAGSALLVSLIFFPQERFRIPVVDPTLIICAAVWLARVK